jgi:hypothetical protein
MRAHTTHTAHTHNTHTTHTHTTHTHGAWQGKGSPFGGKGKGSPGGKARALNPSNL